ncbi:hypothetical protein HPB48_020516 [Haemaphysalis longicornis]|uniref:Uncharacterized protein n=1 Tax=Haemaphysalis longicornis TaxID=44386 RepID=A0A9J6GV35_HAELO|nr:hypothetical protein HPB48_020516 [Haemaphysalis longicornis]
MTVRYSCARPYGEIYSCLLLLLLAPGREICRHHACHGASGVAAAPLQTPVCNKLKKDALTVSHSEPQPRPLWSLKCSHGLPHSGSWGGGTVPAARWPCVRPPAQRRAPPGAATGGARGCLVVESAVHLIRAEVTAASQAADDALVPSDVHLPTA